jgi:hypothetical protein
LVFEDLLLKESVTLLLCNAQYSSRLGINSFVIFVHWPPPVLSFCPFLGQSLGDRSLPCHQLISIRICFLAHNVSGFGGFLADICLFLGFGIVFLRPALPPGFFFFLSICSLTAWTTRLYFLLSLPGVLCQVSPTLGS